jgi:rhodanese-related sulfurtransferase
MKNIKKTIVAITLLAIFGTSFAMNPKPTVKEDGGDVTVEQLDQKGQVKTITHDEVKKWMDTKTGQFVIVDVRTQEEFNQGHLPGAMLVTVTELATPKGQELLPKNLDMPIVVYCRSGNNSVFTISHIYYVVKMYDGFLHHMDDFLHLRKILPVI